jgi:hypothetical protein
MPPRLPAVQSPRRERMTASKRSSLRQPFPEERQGFIAHNYDRLSGFVDQARRRHAVRWVRNLRHVRFGRTFRTSITCKESSLF